jgi:antitoxin (DNA-binding transcriptional repressor) of toxin-antitoxin stability system
MTLKHPITGHSMSPRDCITGAEVLAIHDGHHIVITDDGIEVLHLTPAAALLLAAQLIESVTPADAINTIGRNNQ